MACDYLFLQDSDEIILFKKYCRIFLNWCHNIVCLWYIQWLCFKMSNVSKNKILIFFFIKTINCLWNTYNLPCNPNAYRDAAACVIWCSLYPRRTSHLCATNVIIVFYHHFFFLSNIVNPSPLCTRQLSVLIQNQKMCVEARFSITSLLFLKW